MVWTNPLAAAYSPNPIICPEPNNDLQSSVIMRLLNNVIWFPSQDGQLNEENIIGLVADRG